MIYRGITYFFTVTTLIAALSSGAASQTNSANPKSADDKDRSGGKAQCIGCSVDGKTTPRTPDGHPDLGGFWDNPFQGVSETRPDGSVVFRLGLPKDARKPAAPRTPTSEPSYKPEYAAKVQDIIDRTFGPTSALDPLQHCKPPGVPRAMVPPLHIVQTKDLIVILYEPDATGETFRMIYMDGRQHPKDLDPSYMGDSIGHWEGDTLVVDVTGLNDETWLGGGQQTEKFALMHSDQEHVTERYTRSGDVLTYEATVEDPVVLTKPWVITPRHIQHGGAGDRLYEAFCNGNNDLAHYVEPDRWDFSLQGSRGPTTEILLLQPDCDPHMCQLTGALKSQGNEFPLNGSIKDGKIAFSVKRTAANAEVTEQYAGTIQGDAMTGTVTTGNTTQQWTAKKVLKQ